MNGLELFQRIESLIPLHLALDGDRVGYIGTEDPSELTISHVLVLMDYYPGSGPGAIDYSPYDLVILHHPPQVIPDIPAYVIHSNWDLIPGGANDALADCLLIKTDDVLDPETGLGRIGTVQDGPIILSRFVRYVMRGLQISSVQIVNYAEERLITRVGVVSGFGLNQNLITIAQSRGIDLFISGDLTHPGAMIAKRSDLVLLDATHHATELPGLKKLGELLSGVGVSVQVKDTGVPIGIYTDYYRPVSYQGSTH